MPGSLPNFDHIADADKKAQPALEKCSGCGCEHDEIHNPTDTCATCNGGSRYHMPKAAPAPLPVDIEELLGIAQELPLGPNDAQDLRAFISDLTRRLAEAEAKKEQVVRWHDDLAKKCRDLLDDAVKYTQHRHQLEARAEAADAFKARVMEWARVRCECCRWDGATPSSEKPSCNECSDNGKRNWTPPQAWEVGE